MFSNSPEILQHPRNITVFENTTASFICEISGGFPGWAVNGKPIYQLSVELRKNVDTFFNGDSLLHRLTIIATDEFNGTIVQCFALTTSGFSDQSDLVSLTVQGK